jgi:hypothetical protein
VAFAVQDEITREIVVALSVTLGPGEEARIWSVGRYRGALRGAT